MVEVDRVVDTLGPQGGALQVQRLGAVGLRDADVADQHVWQTAVWDMRAWRRSALFALPQREADLLRHYTRDEDLQDSPSGSGICSPRYPSKRWLI